MSLYLYPKCWRERTDCEPLHCIEAHDENVSEEQLDNFDYVPFSFVCSGCVKEDNRVIQQDMYRLCFKNDVSDEMTDNDIQDLTHILAVISHALAVNATRMINSGSISIPAAQERLNVSMAPQ